MRVLSGLTLLVPTLLSAQEPAQQAASAVPAPWPQQGPAIAAYEAHRAKGRAKVEKSLKELTRREDAWLVVARDEFGLSEANRLDPDGFARAVDLLKWAQRAEDFYRAEDNPSRSAAARDYVKKSLDYYEKLIRIARARIAHHSDFSEMLREELKLMHTHFAPLKATQ